MKVAFITQPFDIIVPEIGGAGSIPILTYKFARCLAAEGHTIHIYGKQDYNHPDTEQDQYGISFHRIDTRWDDWVVKPFKLLDRLTPNQETTWPFFARAFYYRRYIQQIAEELRTWQPDVVHIHNFSQFAPIIRRHNPQAKIVLHMHCEWLTQLNHRFIDQRLDYVDTIIGVSNYITDKIRSQFPQHEAKCHTVFNGVDPDYFIPAATSSQPTNHPPRLLFTGRISPEKGIHILIDAFLQVLQAYPTAELNIIGPYGATSAKFIVAISNDEHVKNLAAFYRGQDYFAQLHELVPSSASANIQFLGYKPQPELLQYYQEADLLINPSLSEAFGMSLVEAMSTETAVIGARVGGMQDVVDDGKTGLLVNPADSASLSAAIKTLLADPQKRHDMGRAGRERVTTLFSWSSVCQDLITLYQSLGSPIS